MTTTPITQAITEPPPIDVHPALSRGVYTSEFWLTLLTGVVFVIGAFVPEPVAQRWGQEHGWLGGLVVAIYVAARAYIKATALKVL